MVILCNFVDCLYKITDRQNKCFEKWYKLWAIWHILTLNKRPQLHAGGMSDDLDGKI